MKKKNYMSWDTYFMSVALISSYRSKDPAKQNGACIVNEDKVIIGTGYNGLPKGCDDNDPEFWNEHDDDTLQVNPRHAYNIHAEKNAIFNAVPYHLKGSTIYVTQFPCNTCAQAIIQVGITKVIYLLKKPHHKQVNDISEKLFSSAGDIELVDYNKLALKDKDFIKKIQKLEEFYSD